MKFLTASQIQDLIKATESSSLANFCQRATESTQNSEAQFSALLSGIGVSPDNIAAANSVSKKCWNKVQSIALL